MIQNYVSIFLNKVARRLKGQSYCLDSSIPLGILLSVSWNRFVCILRSALYFYSPHKKLFINRGVILRSRKLIHLGDGVTLGRCVLIDGLSTNGVKLGDNVNIGEYTRLEASGTITDIGIGISIGKNSGIGGFSFIGGAGGVSIGEDVIMGQFVSFHPENHNFDDLDIPIRLQGVNRKGISIGDNCWVGAKVTFLDGAKVGSGCVIAAGSVVRGEIPDNAIVAGVPAKVIKMREEKE